MIHCLRNHSKAFTVAIGRTIQIKLGNIETEVKRQ